MCSSTHHKTFSQFSQLSPLFWYIILLYIEYRIKNKHFFFSKTPEQSLIPVQLKYMDSDSIYAFVVIWEVLNYFIYCTEQHGEAEEEWKQDIINMIIECFSDGKK